MDVFCPLSTTFFAFNTEECTAVFEIREHLENNTKCLDLFCNIPQKGFISKNYDLGIYSATIVGLRGLKNLLEKTKGIPQKWILGFKEDKNLILELFSQGLLNNYIEVDGFETFKEAIWALTHTIFKPVLICVDYALKFCIS